MRWITLLFILMAVFSACKKELVEIDLDKTTEANDTDVVKIASGQGQNNHISIFSKLRISFSHPIGKPFSSKQGFTMIIQEYSKIFKSVRNGDTTSVSGTWSYNKIKDTLYFIPNGFLPDSATLLVKFSVKLGYTDKTTYVIKTIEKVFSTDENFIMSVNPDTSQLLSPLSKTMTLFLKNHLDEQVNVYNRAIKFELEDISVIDTVSKKQLITTTSFPAKGNIQITSEISWPSAAVLEIKLKLKASEETNGSWEPLKKDGNVLSYYPVIRIKTSVFNISDQNVSYSYPIPYQYYFLKNEYPLGYVKLNAPFITVESGNTFTARFNLLQADSMDVPLTYNKDSNCFTFPIPQTLENQKIYRLRFFAKNNSTGETYVFYDIYFRTSAFNTFAEKWNNITIGETSRIDVIDNASTVISNLSPSLEGFDYFEINQLIKPEALLDKTYWWTTDLNMQNMKIAYTQCNLTWRKVEPYGVPPSKAVYLYTSKPPILTTSLVSNNNARETLTGAQIQYKVPVIVYYDWKDIQDQIENNKVVVSGSWVIPFMRSSFLGCPRLEYYYYSVSYIVQGNIKTSSVESSFYY